MIFEDVFRGNTFFKCVTRLFLTSKHCTVIMTCLAYHHFDDQDDKVLEIKMRLKPFSKINVNCHFCHNVISDFWPLGDQFSFTEIRGKLIAFPFWMQSLLSSETKNNLFTFV